MRNVIAIANQKGGVGKTTTCMSLGAALAKLDKSVLLIDLDPQGNLSEYLGFSDVECSDELPTIATLLSHKAMGLDDILPEDAILQHVEGLDYIPANISLCNCEQQLFNTMSRETVLRRVLDDLTEYYHYILIDCQPSLGVLTLNAFAAATSVIVPVQAQKFAVDGLSSLLGTLRQVQQSINPALQLEGIVQTMTDRTVMSKAVSQVLQNYYGELLFKAVISKSVEAANSTYTRRSLVSYSNKLGEEYAQLAAELVARGDG